MTKQDKKDTIQKLLDYMKDVLFNGIDHMEDNDYHPVELIVSASNSLYIYAQLAQQGLTDKEISEQMAKLADTFDSVIKSSTTKTEVVLPNNVTPMLDRVKKKNETVH
jgi:metal-dependent HD superfamily phosphatase/phosphodiesterase